MPIINFDSLDAVPEELREHAKPDEASGKIQINVVPQVKLTEFRERNISLTKENDELKAYKTTVSTVVGEDISQFNKELESLRQVSKRVQDKELVDTTSLEEAVAKRTTEMRTGYEDQIKNQAKETKAWQSKAEELDNKFRRSVVDRAITDAVLDPKSGARPDALADILQRAYPTFRVTDDNKLIPYQGDAIQYGTDGTSPMTPLEWMTKLKEQAPYFFKGSSGGGAGSSGGGLNANGKFSPEQIKAMSYDEYVKARKDGKI